MNYNVGIEIIYDTEVLKSNLCDYNDAEDLDLAMPKYNFIEYSPNYSQTTGSLWFYSKDEATDFNNIFQTLTILNLLSIRKHRSAAQSK